MRHKISKIKLKTLKHWHKFQNSKPNVSTPLKNIYNCATNPVLAANMVWNG